MGWDSSIQPNFENVIWFTSPILIWRAASFSKLLSLTYVGKTLWHSHFVISLSLPLSSDWVAEFQFICRKFLSRSLQATALEFFWLTHSYRNTHTQTNAAPQNERTASNRVIVHAYLSFHHLVLYKWINLNYSHFADTVIHSLYQLIAYAHRMTIRWIALHWITLAKNDHENENGTEKT